MSGQHPRQDPWYGQQDPAHWHGAPPPPPTRRRTGWIVVAVVAVVAVLAGGGFTALHVLGDSDDSSSSPGEPASDDPTPADEPTPSDDPTTTPVNADPWGSLQPGAEVNEISGALERVDYACYNAMDAAMLTPDEPIAVNGEPVLIRRCYLDPATSRDEEQTVSIQAAPDGSVNGIRVTISALLDQNGQRPARWFRAVVRALTGPVLQESEARAILAGRGAPPTCRSTRRAPATSWIWRPTEPSSRPCHPPPPGSASLRFVGTTPTRATPAALDSRDRR
jgi:hypothetical protein